MAIDYRTACYIRSSPTDVMVGSNSEGRFQYVIRTIESGKEIIRVTSRAIYDGERISRRVANNLIKRIRKTPKDDIHKLEFVCFDSL